MLDPAIRLRHLVTFAEVVRAGGVGRAAASLSVTQPAVSKTVRELEAIVGRPLLARSGRNTVLTRHGEILLRHVEAGLVALRQGVAEMAEGDAIAARPIRVGALPTASARLLPEAVARMMDRGRFVGPRIVTGPNGFLMKALREGELDLVVGRMGEGPEMLGLAFEHLYSEPIVIVARPGHPVFAHQPFDPQAMRDIEMLLPPPGSVIRPAVERLFVSAGLPRPRAVVETVSLAFGRAYVRRSDAAWVISKGVVLTDIADGTLRSLPIATADTMGPVGITRRADAAVVPGLDALLDALRTVAETIRDETED